MTEAEKNEIILRAAIEIDPEHMYEIRQGTLGMTLYITVKDKDIARAVRKKTPSQFEGLRTIVLSSAPHPDYDYSTW
jgi:hypothetical protein